MGKVKVPISEEVLEIWLAEKVKQYVLYVDSKPEILKPSSAREHWMDFVYWLRNNRKLPE